MFKKIKKTNNEGFTIIEVMIVLAIAALILLIVLLAVPALQRNSRNTTIKNDTASVAGGINTFESDNNGSQPTSVVGTGTVTIKDATASSNINVNGSTVVSLTAPAGADVVGSIVKDVPPSNIYVVGAHSCPASGSAVSTASISTRSIELFYVTETTSGNALQCVSS